MRHVVRDALVPYPYGIEVRDYRGFGTTVVYDSEQHPQSGRVSNAIDFAKVASGEVARAPTDLRPELGHRPSVTLPGMRGGPVDVHNITRTAFSLQVRDGRPDIVVAIRRWIAAQLARWPKCHEAADGEFRPPTPAAD